MYVHLKKKHRVTLDKLKTSYGKYTLNLAKRGKIPSIEVIQQSSLKKRYNSFNAYFDKSFQRIFDSIYNENPCLYSEYLVTQYSNYKEHPLYDQIHKIHNIFLDKQFLQKNKPKDYISNIDEAMSVYIFTMWGYAHDNKDNLSNLKIGILLREYLNFSGWEHVKLMIGYKIEDESALRLDKEYTVCRLGEHLPELLDDFIGTYLSNDAPGFDQTQTEIKEFVTELCSMLHNEKLINYRLEPLE
jgi:hypothetical protein